MSGLIATTLNDGIITIDTKTKIYRQKHADKTFYGASTYVDLIVAADNTRGLYFLDHNLEIVDRLDVFAADLHDVEIVGDILYGVDSSTNRIIVVDLASLEIKDEIALFTNNVKDTYHINCLKYYDGYFYLAMFKLIFSHILRLGKWRDKYDKLLELENQYQKRHFKDTDIPMGAILKIDATTFEINDIMIHSLWQPHTIAVNGNKIIFAESLDAKLRSLIDGDTLVQFSKGYYVRGLVTDERCLYVGGSRSRKAKQNEVYTPILMLDRDTYKLVDTVRLPIDYIYDLILIGDVNV